MFLQKQRKLSLWCYPTHKNNLTTYLTPLSKPYSNYHPPLNKCTTIFTIISNCKITLSVLWWIACFASFHKSIREIRLGGFGLSDLFIFVHIGLVFDLAYKTCKNYCIYIFSLKILLTLLYYPVSTKYVYSVL